MRLEKENVPLWGILGGTVAATVCFLAIDWLPVLFVMSLHVTVGSLFTISTVDKKKQQDEGKPVFVPSPRLKIFFTVTALLGAFFIAFQITAVCSLSWAKALLATCAYLVVFVLLSWISEIMATPRRII